MCGQTRIQSHRKLVNESSQLNLSLRLEHLKTRQPPKPRSRIVSKQPKWAEPIVVVFLEEKKCNWTKTCNWILSISICSALVIDNRVDYTTTRHDDTISTSRICKFHFNIGRGRIKTCNTHGFFSP